MGQKHNKRSKTKLGDKYNILTVVEEPYLTTHLKINHFKCKVRCDCGKEFITKCTQLRNNIIVSCKNCSFRKREKNRDQVSQIYQIFRRKILYRVTNTNIPVRITVDEYEKIARQNCYYCDSPPEKINIFNTRKYVNKEPLFLNGIDRKDPSIGYTIENCVPCCSECNYSKHILTEKQFYEKVTKIYNNIKERL